MKTKKKFTAGIWIVGVVNGHSVIGRTILKNNIESVSLVTELGTRFLAAFDEIEDIRKVMIEEEKKPAISCTLGEKKRHTVIESLIIEMLNSINKA